MTSTLDMCISNEITLVYTAKNIAPFLHVTVPEPPLEWKRITRAMKMQEAISEAVEKTHSAYLFIFDKNGYDEKKRNMAEEERTLNQLCERRDEDNTQFEEELKRLGIATQQERDAWTITHYAGSSLKTRIYHADLNNDGAEIIKRKEGVITEIKVPPELFDNYLKISVKNGIMVLKGHYWISIMGVPTPEIVNPDFEENATRWLKNEVYLRTEEGKQCKLLESIGVQKEENGKFLLSL